MSLAPNRRVTVVMYHFVRELKNSRFPGIKGLSLEEFQGQIEYVQRYYQVISCAELLAGLEDPDTPLPPRALLLTFDDGYRDHFENVLPILAKAGIAGCFYPPAKAITEHQVLDVNKIHFVLAAVPDKTGIVDAIFALLDEARGEFSLEDRDYYHANLAHPNRYDTGEVVLIKRLLQRELPETLRNRIVATLFREYVTRDEAGFSQELYMSISELQTMREAGMHIGSHGFDHYWLDTLDAPSQEREIDLSLRFLRDVGGDVERWTIAYPYGAYDDALLAMLRRKGCKAGFTTEVGIADVGRDDPLTLPRLDTNDLPKEGAALPNKWTLEVIAEAPPT